MNSTGINMVGLELFGIFNVYIHILKVYRCISVLYLLLFCLLSFCFCVALFEALFSLHLTIRRWNYAQLNNRVQLPFHVNMCKESQQFAHAWWCSSGARAWCMLVIEVGHMLHFIWLLKQTCNPPQSWYRFITIHSIYFYLSPNYHFLLLKNVGTIHLCKNGIHERFPTTSNIIYNNTKQAKWEIDQYWKSPEHFSSSVTRSLSKFNSTFFKLRPSSWIRNKQEIQISLKVFWLKIFDFIQAAVRRAIDF